MVTGRRRPAAAQEASGPDPGPSRAVQECDQAVDWYARNARRCRVRHQVLEVLLLIVGASISVVALAVPAAGVPTAVLGAVVVLLGGLRQVFHWHENYVRFTQACQKLKAERRRYAVGQPPYDDPVQRDKKLVERLNRVEYEETMGWSELMQDRSPSSAQPK